MQTDDGKRIIWGCRWAQLQTPMRNLESVLFAMADAVKGDFIIDGDEQAVYMVGA